MANQLFSLLKHWQAGRDTGDWVLGTVYKTDGPAYRKAGAMMLFNSLGQQFGMLSGGCLESDIQTHARRVMQTGEAVSLCYDGSDEDDLSFQLGIGCGGKVYILLQSIHTNNNYLELDKVLTALTHRQQGLYYQQLPNKSRPSESSKSSNGSENHFRALDNGEKLVTKRVQEGDDCYLYNVITPEPHLLVIGGGIDARPLVNLGHELGWQVSLWDPRPANARPEFFMAADKILNCKVEDLKQYAQTHSVNAAVLMSHNLSLDAAALQQLQGVNYLALLGPLNRRQRVIEAAGLNGIKLNLAGPAGLDIGAELPESIALAILAECHACLKQSSGRSLSGLFDKSQENKYRIESDRIVETEGLL